MNTPSSYSCFSARALETSYRFEEISMGRMTYFMMPGMLDDEYEVKTKTRQGNLGTDLPTLLAVLDADGF